MTPQEEQEMRSKVLQMAQNNFDDGEYIVDGQDWRRFLDGAMALFKAQATQSYKQGRIDEAKTCEQAKRHQLHNPKKGNPDVS